MDWTSISNWLLDNQVTLIRVGVLIFVGFPLARLIAAFLRATVSKHFSGQSAMLCSKAFLYSANIIIILMVISELDFKLGPVLGAAGIAGVAIGFASQTSLSNLISGVFLIWEKPFEVNDVLDVNGTLGTIYSVDLLSVKLRTFDNKLVRIPNETLVKGTFTNITRFPIRRFDIDISVAYKEDIQQVTDILKDIADNNPYSLDEPAPIVLLKRFGDSGLEFMLGVWFEKSEFLTLRSTIMKDIKERFDAEGIEIPFPHLSIYTGSETKPFPVSITDQGKDEAEQAK